jgi:glucose/arabinose dehydrogenase
LLARSPRIRLPRRRRRLPFTDYRYEKPGATRKITTSDLPAPFATKSAMNGPAVADRPKNVWPQAPAGFKVELYTTEVQEPRKIITAPNGDFFVVQSHDGNVKIFRGITADGKPQQTSVFATGLNQPTASRFIRRGRIHSTFTLAIPMPCCASLITPAI